MTNINNFNPRSRLINEFTIFGNGSVMFDISYFEKFTPHVVFNDIECVFKKSGINSYLVFCQTEKNKKMLAKIDKDY